MTEQHDDAGDWYEVIVEIPQGTRNKYEIDHDSGAIWLDRPPCRRLRVTSADRR